MVMTVAVIAVFMVMVIMVMIMAVAFLTMFVMVMLMVVIVVMVLMSVVVSAGTFVLVNMEIHTGIFHRMHHCVLQFALIHIHHGGHEVEIRLLGGFQTVVVLHTDVQIGKIEGYALTVDGDGHLDVAHQITGLLLDPSSHLHHHGIQSCLRIGVETVDVSGETYAYTAGQLFRVLHQITSKTSFTPSPEVAHIGMTLTPGNSEFSQSLISFIFSGGVRSFLFIAMISDPESCLT